jgi:AAA+ ATPase superfamily predicted ATPase
MTILILRYEITYNSGGYKVDQAILTGIAQGDRRTTTSFKRAFVSFEEGSRCVEKIIDRGIIEIESSQHHLAKKRGDDKVAKKLLFTAPFLRFWFAFVSPIYKGIKEKNYKEFFELYENKEAEFGNFIFEELAMECLRDTFTEDPIKQFGRYWDDKNEIDLVAKTISGKIIAGNCKYITSKLKKNELNKLKEDSTSIDLNVDILFYLVKMDFQMS